jgi:hypothetical protein
MTGRRIMHMSGRTALPLLLALLSITPLLAQDQPADQIDAITTRRLGNLINPTSSLHFCILYIAAPDGDRAEYPSLMVYDSKVLPVKQPNVAPDVGMHESIKALLEKLVKIGWLKQATWAGFRYGDAPAHYQPIGPAYVVRFTGDGWMYQHTLPLNQQGYDYLVQLRKASDDPLAAAIFRHILQPLAKRHPQWAQINSVQPPLSLLAFPQPDNAAIEPSLGPYQRWDLKNYYQELYGIDGKLVLSQATLHDISPADGPISYRFTVQAKKPGFYSFVFSKKIDWGTNQIQVIYLSVGSGSKPIHRQTIGINPGPQKIYTDLQYVALDEPFAVTWDAWPCAFPSVVAWRLVNVIYSDKHFIDLEAMAQSLGKP